LRTPRAAILMSGGLDSTSVAAFARKARPETELKACTVVYDWLIPDDERHYAALLAKHLGIPIEFCPIDGVRPFENAPELSMPEPIHDPLSVVASRVNACVANHAAVSLTGHGADALFYLTPL